MQAMCPDPENSYIPEDEDTRGPRQALRMVYLAQYGYIIMKAIALGPIAGLLQLIFLWILYITYATMYFCQAMLCGIFLMIELIQMMVFV